MANKFIIIDREAGNVIEHCHSYEEAKRKVAEYEATDKEQGNYSPDFYVICKKEQQPMLPAMSFAVQAAKGGTDLQTVAATYDVNIDELKANL